MKSLFIIVFLMAFQNSIYHSVAFGSDKQGSHNENNGYQILSHVIGSGGLSGATNSSQNHWATAGQAIIQGSSGSNHILISGFWHSSDFGPTAVDDISQFDYPHAFELFQNYPNPFNPQTIIQYDLPCICTVKIEIYNIFGQSIYTMDFTNQGPGREQVIWNAQNEFGIKAGTGIYFFRITAFEAEKILFQKTRKMLLVK